MDYQWKIEMEKTGCVLESKGQLQAISNTSRKDVIIQSAYIVENATVDSNADGAFHQRTKELIGTDDVDDSSSDNAINKFSVTNFENTDVTVASYRNTLNDQNGTSSGSAINESDEETDYSVNTNIDEPSNTAANEITVTVDKTNICIAIDANTDSSVAASADSVDANAPNGLCVDPAMDMSTDAASSKITGSSKDSVDKNIVTTISENIIPEIVTSKDDYDKGRTSLVVQLVDKRKGTTSDDVSNAYIERKNNSDLCAISYNISDDKTCCDVEDVLNSKEENGSNSLKCPMPLGHKAAERLTDSLQASISKDADCQYDLEIEIVDYATGNHVVTAVTENAVVRNADPQLVPDATDDTLFAAHSDAAVNSSVSDNVGSQGKRSRFRKRETYEQRCRNMRLYKMKLKSGDAIQTTKPKNKTSNCLDKLTQNNLKFMENFDPKRSNRERRKLLRKTNAKRNLKTDLYGLNGTLISSGKNLCDCMNPHCPGCHFPCPRCNSPKCGHECRVNRKWTYEEIEIDGTDIVIKPQELIESFTSQS